MFIYILLHVYFALFGHGSLEPLDGEGEVIAHIEKGGKN